MKKSSYIGPSISRYQFEGLKNKGWIVEYALEVYKRRPNVVALMELDIGSRFQKVVVKCYGWRDSKGPLISPFRQSCAEKTWEVTHLMRDAGLPVPKPVAVYTQRTAGFIEYNIYISEYAGIHQKSNRIFDSEIEEFLRKRDTVMKIAKIIADMHNAGFIHNNLVKDNFLVTEDDSQSVVLVDLTEVEHKETMTIEEKMDDIAKLDLCDCHLEHDHDDCLWLYFLLGYDYENANTLINHLRKSIQRRRENKLKSATQ